jgi:hypothetical protein
VSMDAAVRESAICWAELLERKEPDLKDTLADTLRTKAKKSPKAFTDPLLQVSGSEVDIVPWKEHGLSARLSLSWADNSGEMHHLDATSKGRHGLSVAGSVMPTYEDKRFIYFVPEGVDIRDSVGTSLGERVLRSGIMKPVTLPLSDIISQLENDPIKDKFSSFGLVRLGLISLAQSLRLEEASALQKHVLATFPRQVPIEAHAQISLSTETKMPTNALRITFHSNRAMLYGFFTGFSLKLIQTEGKSMPPILVSFLNHHQSG